MLRSGLDLVINSLAGDYSANYWSVFLHTLTHRDCETLTHTHTRTHTHTDTHTYREREDATKQADWVELDLSISKFSKLETLKKYKEIWKEKKTTTVGNLSNGLFQSNSRILNKCHKKRLSGSKFDWTWRGWLTVKLGLLVKYIKLNNTG